MYTLFIITAFLLKTSNYVKTKLLKILTHMTISYSQYCNAKSSLHLKLQHIYNTVLHFNTISTKNA